MLTHARRAAAATKGHRIASPARAGGMRNERVQAPFNPETHTQSGGSGTSPMSWPELVGHQFRLAPHRQGIRQLKSAREGSAGVTSVPVELADRSDRSGSDGAPLGLGAGGVPGLERLNDIRVEPIDQ